MKRKKDLLLVLFIVSFLSLVQSQQDVSVDKNGVMRWPDQTEVKGFGVNYTVPFAHGYRFAKSKGIDIKEAIRKDVYHFSRLGFDLYRVHVWDTEISDTLGNLIENEHLELFDFLLKELKDKGIHCVITPIAFWGNGWPERDEDTPGFSHKYGKDGCLSNPAAIEAQKNYLVQFLNHVNPYTGVAYKDEPNIIAFEVSNEPHHSGEALAVTNFIRCMVKAMRKGGTKKPIFYNISHAVHFAEAYFEAGIQGGTFQWYPTGLGYQRELSCNLLPNVNAYEIPFNETIKKYHGAKIVYEFDAADVAKSYIYPLMARSFREAGIQIATQFAYDPTYSAYANTEYNTHYMNLAYTPQKALSLMISAEVFHRIPMNEHHGIYPENLDFDHFKVDYQHNLAEYNSGSKFIYTNHTHSKPEDESKLIMVAGFGNSEVICYDGLGVYFLDKINDGVWRLEVMPDAVSVDDPFGRNSPQKTVSVINWKTHNMRIQLKDIGTEFKVEAINAGNNHTLKVENDSFLIMPGTYILSRKGTVKKWHPDDTWGPNKLNDFFAPPTSVTKPWFKHEPVSEASALSPLTMRVQYIGPIEAKEIKLIALSNGKTEVFTMEPIGGYSYSATIPAQMLEAGYLSYHIVVKQKDDSFMTFPANKEGHPFDWDFYDRNTYKVKVVPQSYPIHLFDALHDADLLVKQWRNTFRLVPTTNQGEAEYQMNIEQLFEVDVENLQAKPVYDYSFKHFILKTTEGRRSDLSLMKDLIFKGRALNDKACLLQIAFVMDNGAAFGSTIEIGTDSKDYKLSLASLKLVKTVLLPRPYPSFLPYYLTHDMATGFDINKVESIQFSIGPNMPSNQLNEKHGVAIISLRLE